MLIIDPNPVIVRGSVNPADGLVHNGVVLLGTTIPCYNGERLTRPPRRVLAPIASVSRLRPPVSGFAFQAHITSMPRHRVHFRVELPPDPAGGRWTALRAPGSRLKALVAGLFEHQRSLGEGIDPALERAIRAMPDAAACTLEIVCRPSGAEFMQHVLHHELQHVADHVWLTRQILGRWDGALEEICRAGKVLVSRRGFDLAAIPNLFDYASGVQAIFTYWWRTMMWSGARFHGTEEGAEPRLRVERVDERSVVLAISARRPMARPPDLRHARPHREFRVKGQWISGTETSLEYGAPEDLRLRLRQMGDRFLVPS